MFKTNYANIVWVINAHHYLLVLKTIRPNQCQLFESKVTRTLSTVYSKQIIALIKVAHDRIRTGLL